MRGKMPGPVNMAWRKQYSVSTAQLMKLKKTTLPPQVSSGGHHCERQFTVANVTDFMMPVKLRSASAVHY